MKANKEKKLAIKGKATLGMMLTYMFVIVFSFICLYPFLLLIGGSLTTQYSAMRYGFRVIPREFTWISYEMILADPTMIITGYRITITVTIIGTILAVLINSMMGYVVSRKSLPGRSFLNFYALFTMLFSGGMVPWYIITTRYLGLVDNIWALILPIAASAWNVFLVRNYFSGIPESLWESGKLDGASEFTIFSRIYLPLGKPVIATITLFSALAYWNDWWLGLMLINRPERQPLQMLLRSMMANIHFLQGMTNNPSEVQAMLASVPGDGVRMAMVVLTTGPIIFLYPFLQRYFMKGIMIGAVKG